MVCLKLFCCSENCFCLLCAILRKSRENTMKNHWYEDLRRLAENRQASGGAALYQTSISTSIDMHWHLHVRRSIWSVWNGLRAIVLLLRDLRRVRTHALTSVTVTRDSGGNIEIP
ncbi:expressed unknown protein [Seminavis robusta]|uniref:Uncharacterized protein n=1 Tax=Seminavis robusta TaxID=568900 RepID=A0A9N8DBL7_9STRA|nr:expressed unknown protein [Seminavis robusta]|eukprot:Sro47_g027811.1  (115) ;mRNA; r:70629-70973